MAKINVINVEQQQDRTGNDIIRDLSVGQVTQRDGDKIDFSQLQRCINFNVEEGDLEIRNGIEDLVEIKNGDTIVDVFGFDIFEDGTTNRLVVAKVGASDDTKTDIVEYNRDDGSQTVLESDVDSQSEHCFASQNTFLYIANGETDIQVIDPGQTTTTIAMPNANEYAIQLVSDGSSIWVLTTDKLVRISDIQTEGKITTFAPSGTDLGRAAIVNSNISNAVSLKAAAPYVAIASQNRVEICSRPNLQEQAIDTFPDNYPTMKIGFDGIGTTSKDGMVGTPFGFFIMPPNRNTLYLLTINSSKPKEILGNFGRFKEIDHTDAKLTYDDKRGYLYIHGVEKLTRRSVVTVYDVLNDSFWEYSDILVSRWAGDQENMYFIPNYSSIIVEAFKDDVYLDNGAEIEYLAETADTYSGDLEYWKFAERFFANVEYWGDLTFNAQLLDQRKAKGDGGIEVFNKTFEFSMNDSPLGDSPPYFGLGIFGNTGFDFERENFSESFNIDELINNRFFRGIAKISGSSNIRFRIRGAGILFKRTTKPFTATILS